MCHSEFLQPLFQILPRRKPLLFWGALWDRLIGAQKDVTPDTSDLQLFSNRRKPLGGFGCLAHSL
jgi:hypothetical protein